MPLLLPAERVTRWFGNFADRHGRTRLSVLEGALHGEAEDGSTALARLPFDATYDGPADATAFAGAVGVPSAWGVLLVRKGGFAVARLEGDRLVAHKIGQRHVQGRSKAGGQSQQRFARRRGHQARLAYEAATDHALRIFEGGIDVLVTGGDRNAVEQCLAHPRLQWWVRRVDSRWLTTPDPRRQVLDEAVLDARAVAVDVVNA